MSSAVRQTRRRPPREAACGEAAGARRPGSSRSACAPGAHRPRKRHRATLPLRSGTPARALARRASTNSRSESRFRSTRAGRRPPRRRRARRHGARPGGRRCAPGEARHRQAAAGNTKRRSGGNSASASSIQASSRSVSSSANPALVTRAAIAMRGSASCAPRANRSRCMRSSSASIAGSTPAARACPEARRSARRCGRTRPHEDQTCVRASRQTAPSLRRRRFACRSSPQRLYRVAFMGRCRRHDAPKAGASPARPRLPHRSAASAARQRFRRTPADVVSRQRTVAALALDTATRITSWSRR